MSKPSLLLCLLFAVTGEGCRNCFGPIYFNQSIDLAGKEVLANITNSTGFIDCCASCNIDFYPECKGWAMTDDGLCLLTAEKPVFVNKTNSTAGVPPGGSPDLKCRNCFGSVNYDSGFNLTTVVKEVVATLHNISSWINCCATCEIEYVKSCHAWTYTPPANGGDGNGTCTFLSSPPTGPYALLNGTDSSSGTPPTPRAL